MLELKDQDLSFGIPNDFEGTKKIMCVIVFLICWIHRKGLQTGPNTDLSSDIKAISHYQKARNLLLVQTILMKRLLQKSNTYCHEVI